MTCSGDKKSLLFKDCGCGCNGKKQEKKFIFPVAPVAKIKNSNDTKCSWVSDYEKQ